jgi:hypothetical protein
MTKAATIAGALLFLLTSACNGNSSTSPSDLIALPDGNYSLTISPGTLPPIGGSPTFCMSNPGGPLSMNISLPVVVTRSAEGWMVRMPQASGPGGGTLQMTVAAASERGSNGVPAVVGRIEGLALSSDGSLTLTIPEPSAISGTQPSTNTLRGQIQDSARVESAQGSLTCRASVWTLGPR